MSESPTSRRRVTLDWPELAGQFVVTVVGILLALALNAWWGARQDARRADVYVRELLEDVRRSDAQLTTAIRRDSLVHVAALDADSALTGHLAAVARDARVRQVLAMATMNSDGRLFVLRRLQAQTGTLESALDAALGSHSSVAR